MKIETREGVPVSELTKLFAASFIWPHSVELIEFD